MIPLRQPLKVAALLTGLLFSLTVSANESREITWDDLVPAEAEFDDV